jgi:hypothetical protein
MILTNKRIRNIDNVLFNFKENEEVLIILYNAEKYKDILEKLGFNKLDCGETVLPKSVGSISKYNADGKYELLRNLPKENYYMYMDILAFGKYDITVTIPRKRFQRNLIDAPSEELIIDLDKDGEKIVSSKLIKITEENKPLIKHIINLFLEIFGECHIVDKNLISRIPTPTKRLNWNLLPKGTMSWEKLETHLESNIKVKSIKNLKDIYARINYINSFKPNFVATGNAGFNDYIVLGFEDKNLYILENHKPQNATYIFEKNWEELTKYTKGDILREKWHKKRLLHTQSWREEIKKILTFN